MKKLLTSLFILTLCLSLGQAQNNLVSGFLPDIEIVDIEGNTYRPYEALSEGKSLIINVFSTVCGPCWEYYESEAVQNVYEQYGPNGSDEVEVYFIEGNLNTDLDDISGIGPNSLGNYLNNTPYPVFNNNQLPFDLGIHTFPSVLYICPNKEITEIPYFSETELVDHIEASCPQITVSNNADLLYYSSDLSPSCGEDFFTPVVVVQNNGSNIIEHISLSLSANGFPIVDSTGYDVYIEQYQVVSLPIPLGPIYESTNIKTTILDVNHAYDNSNEFDELLAQKPVIQSMQQEFILQFQTDDFGYETYWKVINENQEVVAEGGNELVQAGAQQDYEYLLTSDSYYPANTSIQETINLSTGGCYTFIIEDDWGDGICCTYGSGNFEIIDLEGNVLIENKLFLEEFHVDFSNYNVTSSSAEIFQQTDLDLFPNPATDLLNLRFESSWSGSTNFDIYSAQGVLITSVKHQTLTGENLLTLDLSNLEMGFYFITSQFDNKNYHASFQVIR